MSVYTTADATLDVLKKHLQTIESELKWSENLIEKFLDPDTWGSDNYKYDFCLELTKLESDLLTLRRKLVNFRREHP